MSNLTASTWAASLALHALMLLPLVSLAGQSSTEVYDDGKGNDAFRLEQGMTIEAISFGDAVEQVQIAEVTPMMANPTPPPMIEAKPVEPELAKVITATESLTQVAAVTEEPRPPEPPKPQEVATRDQVAQIETYTEKSAGQAQDGGKAQAMSAYVGKIFGALQRAKTPVVGGGVGQVTLGFKLDANGKVVKREVLKSSGVAALDRAAVEWLERAEFPPLPGVLDAGQQFNVPLTFTRKSG
jgi:periplasmic protein TonB